MGIGVGPNVVAAFSQAGNANSVGWATYSLVVVIDSSLIAGVTGAPQRIRAYLAASTAQGFDCDGLYVGHQNSTGDAYDAVSLAQMTWAGSGTKSVAANTSEVTDWCSFAWNKVDKLLFSFHCSGSASADDLRARNGLTGANTYAKQAVSQAATPDKTAYGTVLSNEAVGILAFDIEEV